MRRVLVFVLGLLLFTTGCAPKDPLDRKVSADTPGDLVLWWDRARKHFPEEQRVEIARVIRDLQDNTPRLKAMRADDKFDPLCKQIDGLTVREVLILGYSENNRVLRNRVLKEMGRLPALVNAGSETPEREARTKRAREYAAEEIDRLNRQITGNEDLIAALRPAQSKP
jgi:hypothetical protein